VVLMDDGTVRAFGDNSFGQTEVSSWQNVVWVAAGAYHTLGLTEDGRVLSCGDNTHGQTDTSLFGGVKAIAAGDYASFLLLETGEVMSFGYHSYEFLQQLAGTQRIWAGSYGVLAQAADGLHASHPGLALQGQVKTAALSRGYAVGIDAQGNVHSTTPMIPAWTGAECVAAGENTALALTADGQVLAHVFGSFSRYDFTFDQPVTAVAAGPNHCAFVLADGSLEIRRTDREHESHVLSSGN
jgi:hypothetical protein